MEEDGEPEFITLKARELHDEFKANYENWLEVQALLQSIQPSVVTQSIRIKVS